MTQKLVVRDKTYILDSNKAIQSGAAKQIGPYSIGQIFCLKRPNASDLVILARIGANTVTFILLTSIKYAKNLGDRWTDGIVVKNVREISELELRPLSITAKIEYVGEGKDLPTILAEFYALHNPNA